MFKDIIKQRDKVAVALGAHKFVLEELHQFKDKNPSIWTGYTVDGNPVHIHYNFACLSVRIAKKDEEAHLGKEIFSVVYGNDPMEGEITLEDVAMLCEERLDFSNVLDL